jgi:hypothetical protein
MGNLGEEELDAIWDGPRFRTFRAFLQSPTPLPVCDTCFVRGWRTEVPPLPAKPRTALRKLLARLGIGRTEPRLRVWTDPGVHRPGEPLSINLGLEAGSLLGGGPLDLFVFVDDAPGSRHFVSYRGRVLTVVPEPAPLIAAFEPLDFEWLDVRGLPPRDWSAGEWSVTAALAPAGGGLPEGPGVLAEATCRVGAEADAASALAPRSR